MKKYFLFIMLFMSLSVSDYAQQAFAPDGAEWYHEMEFGSFHSFVAGDTVIQGISAKKIIQTALVRNPWFGWGLKVYNLPTFYLHDGGDTVFVYNAFFSSFTPLFVFSAQEGDTLRFPMLPVHGNGFSTNSTDSSFYIVIDSVRMVQYDTSLLKTFFTRSIDFSGSNYMRNWGIDTTNGVYAEKLGGVNTGFFPNCVGFCIWLLTDNIQGQGPLRCYHDSSYTIKRVANDCDNEGFSTSAPGISRAEAVIKIFPNPANDFIYFRVTGLSSYLITLYDLTGRALLNMASPGNSLSTANLPDGIYLIRVTHKNHAVFYQKLIIQHY